jgi:SPIRAL1-like protein
VHHILAKSQSAGNHRSCLAFSLHFREQNPAGGIDSLRQRLKDHMLSSGDFSMKNDDGTDMATVCITAGLSSSELTKGNLQNNYQRAAGQNVGNFLTERPSSRILAAPGGGSQVRQLMILTKL